MEVLQSRVLLRPVDYGRSVAFYRDVLGLQIAGGGRISVYIKHPATPWYLVVLPMPKRKKPLRPVNRFTLTLASADDVEKAHRELGSKATELQAIERGEGCTSFLFSDLDRNWWEVRA